MDGQRGAFISAGGPDTRMDLRSAIRPWVGDWWTEKLVGSRMSPHPDVSDLAFGLAGDYPYGISDNIRSGDYGSAAVKTAVGAGLLGAQALAGRALMPPMRGVTSMGTPGPRNAYKAEASPAVASQFLDDTRASSPHLGAFSTADDMAPAVGGRGEAFRMGKARHVGNMINEQNGRAPGSPIDARDFTFPDYMRVADTFRMTYPKDVRKTMLPDEAMTPFHRVNRDRNDLEAMTPYDRAVFDQQLRRRR